MNENNNFGNTNNNSNFAGNIANNHLNADNSNSLNDVNQTFDEAQRNRLNSGLILAEKSKKGGNGLSQQGNSKLDSGGSGSSSNTSSSSNLSSNTSTSNTNRTSNSSNTSRVSPQKGFLRREIAKKAAQHYLGLSSSQANALINASNKKSGIKGLNGNKNKDNLLDRLADRDKFLDDDTINNEDDIDSKSKTDKKSEIEERRKVLSGEINAQIPKKVLKVILIIAPFAAIILFFTVAVLAYIDDNKISSMELGGATSEIADQELIDLAKEVDAGKSSGNLGKGSDGIPQEYIDRLSLLGNLYTSQLKCEGDDCLDRAEFKYYLKISNIAYRYREKYSIKLDWLLITATNLYFPGDTEKIMEDNLGGYNENSVKNTDSVTSLDWDYDYKNISNYEYLDADDSTYDLQILAKNMVKKKTTQTCYSSSGSVSKTQEDEDVEDKYFEENGSKRLKCESGEKYIITSFYDVDMEKFDEFMLEYIDKKMFSKGSGKSKKQNSSNSCVSTNDSYIWPVGSDETTTSNGKEYALGEPAITNITSYFGSNESFRSSGHGAIDIAGGTGAGVTNVIAAKSGTVVYPPDESMTKFPDNGYYGNPDGGGYGNYIVIKHDDGNFSLYAHLAQNSVRVVAGDVVDQGQVIAKLGHSGSSTGPHLHFEMRGGENSNTHRIDPLQFVDPKDPRKNITTSTNCSQEKNQDLADVFVDLALKQKEDPKAKNGIKYKEGATSYYPWCAAFVNWIINNTESNGKKLSDIIKSSENKAPYTAYSWANHFESQKDLKFKYNDNCSTLSGKNNSSNTYVPKKGDLIFFSDDRSFTSLPATYDNINHIGIVQGIEGDKIITIEGNSNNEVAERTYPLNSCQVIGFGSWY